MHRRKFTQISLASTFLATTSRAFAEEYTIEPFKAKFAPTFGQLPTAPQDYLDQLKFAYDLGFRAWEDNWLIRRDKKLWPKIAEFCKDKNMSLGVSVISIGHGLDFSNPSEDGMKHLIADLNGGIDLAKATGQTNMTFLPGSRNKMPVADQITKSVDTMTRCCDIVEEHGIILALEPVSHPIKKKDPLLRSFEDGHMLCEKVNRKSCKLLADFYHEGQIGHGDRLIEIAEKVWDQVTYVQYADSPGRKEPGTGKLDLATVTNWLRKKNYEGIIGMEHKAKGKGPQGLKNLVSAYRKIDA